MRKTTKMWLATAASLVAIGLILFVAVMTACNWDFTKLSTEKYETSAHKIGEKFSGISMDTDTADILFAPAEDGKCRVICYETENVRHSVSVENGMLAIRVVDERKWYEYIGIMLGTPRITVYLPEAEYSTLFIKESTGDIEIPRDFKFEGVDISLSTGNVKHYASVSGDIRIKTSTGDIRVENVSAKALDLSVSTGGITVSEVRAEGDVKINVSTGKTKMSNVVCKNVISSGSTGDISLKNVIATERFSIARGTGDVRFDGADAAEIFVETDTGDVTGTLLSAKVFIVETDTGRVDVPKTVTGGRCEITTDTGDIRIKIQQ